MKNKSKFLKTSNILFMFGIIAYLLAGFFTLQKNISWIIFVAFGIALFLAGFYFREYKDN